MTTRYFSVLYGDGASVISKEKYIHKQTEAVREGGKHLTSSDTALLK